MTPDNSPTHRNIGKLIIERAARNPERIAVSIANRRVPYETLIGRSLQYALKLQQHGVGRGSRVVLATQYPTSSYCAMIAIALLGATWLKNSSGLARPRLGITHILLDVEDARLGADHRAVKILQDWNTLHENASEVFASMPGNVAGEDLAVIAESSGTTGMSKLIPMSYDLRWGRVTRGEMGFKEPDPVISVHMFPVTAASSSSQDMRVLAAGGTTVHGGGYRSWLERGVNQVSASPSHILTTVFPEPPPASGEPRILRLWLRGSKPSKQFLERALGYFDEVVNGYGATEAGGTMTQTITRENLDQNLDILKLAPGADAQVVDDDDNVLPYGTPGTIRIRSKAQATSYLNDPEQSQKAFRDGWFYPGDLATISESGDIMLFGRANDQFNLAGLKVSAVLVDQAAQAVPGVADAMCFVERNETGVDELSMLIVPAADSDEAAIARAVVAECTLRLGKERVPRRVYAGPIPKNENGKAVRSEGTKSVSQYRRLM